MTQQEWKKVAQPERWKWTPQPGQAIIGEYRGRATTNGMYGPYTKHFITAETEGGHKIFSISGVVLDNIMLMVNVGDTIRLVFDRIDSTGCRHWSVYKPVYGARVEKPHNWPARAGSIRSHSSAGGGRTTTPGGMEELSRTVADGFGGGPEDFGGSDYACSRCGGELCTGQCPPRDYGLNIGGFPDPDTSDR